jgi:hypothetical protein
MSLVAGFNTDNDLVWCTAFGGNQYFDQADALEAANGFVFVAGITVQEQYASIGCAPPETGFTQCQSDSTVFLYPAMTGWQGYVAAFRSSSQQLLWSSLLGRNQEPTALTYNPFWNRLYVAKRYADDDLLLAHPDHYTITDENYPGTEFVLAFDSFRHVYGSRWGGNSQDWLRSISYGETLDRLYIGGHTYSGSIFPLHCPDTEDPWCVFNLTGPQDVFYAQLKWPEEAVGLPEPPAMAGSSTDLHIFPNPTAGWFRVMHGGMAGAGMLEVYDALGRLVQRKQWPAGQAMLELDLEEQVTVLYLLRLAGPEGQFYAAGRLLLQR